MKQPLRANRPPVGWRQAFGWSLGLHALVIVALILTSQTAPAQPLQHAIIAELVAKGEPQKKKELPRRVRTKRKRRGQRRAPKRTLQKKTLQSANDALQRLEAQGDADDADDALARIANQAQTGDDPDQAKGKKAGSDKGTLSQGELTSLQNNYLSQVGQAIKADGNYRISDTISAAQRVRLSAVLFLRIGRQGQLLEARLEQSSGDDQFDRDILAAARSARYPKPPTELAARLSAGVRGTFKP